MNLPLICTIYSGVDEPGFHVMMDLQTELVYLVPPALPEDYETVWKGAPDTSAQLHDKYDADVILDESELAAHVAHATTIYTMDTTDLSNLQISPHRSCRIDRSALVNALCEARLTKFPWEIAMIKHAGYVSSVAHKMVMKRHAALRTELVVAAYFRYVSALHGLERQAYIPIVASGPRAATLHYNRNNQPIPTANPHAVVLVDAGAEWRCYASDVTRTFPASQKFSPEARTIYSIVLKMQEVHKYTGNKEMDCKCNVISQAVLSRLKPGVMWIELEDLALRILCIELIRIGILRGDEDELLEFEVPRAFYYHGKHHEAFCFGSSGD